LGIGASVCGFQRRAFSGGLAQKRLSGLVSTRGAFVPRVYSGGALSVALSYLSTVVVQNVSEIGQSAAELC